MKKLINILSIIFIVLINTLLYFNISFILLAVIFFYAVVFLLYSEEAFFILLILLFVYIPLFLFLFIVHWQIKMKGLIKLYNCILDKYSELTIAKIIDEFSLIKLYNCILDKYSELTIAKIIDEFRTNKKWQKITLLIAGLLDITGVILLFNFYSTNNNEQNILSIFIMVIMIYLMACGGLLPSYINLFKNWNSKYLSGDYSQSFEKFRVLKNLFLP